MANARSRTQKVARSKAKNQETDGSFILKMVVFLMLGVLWIRIIPYGQPQLPIPIGAIVGLLFARHDKFQIDRKIEYVLLLVAMFIGFWLPTGFDIYL